MISRGALAGFICKPVQSLATLNGAFDFVRMSQPGVNNQQINTTYHLDTHTHMMMIIIVYLHILIIYIYMYIYIYICTSITYPLARIQWSKQVLIIGKRPASSVSKIAESNSIYRGKTAQIFHMPYPGGR